MRDKNSSHSANKFYVCKNKVNMFLDESLWPSGIIFRRFVTSRYKYNENTDNASRSGSATARATSATTATSATCDITISNNYKLNGNK